LLVCTHVRVVAQVSELCQFQDRSGIWRNPDSCTADHVDMWFNWHFQRVRGVACVRRLASSTRRDSRAIYQFGATMICLIILMIIEAIVIAVTVSECSQSGSDSASCAFEPWALVYPRLIGIIIFCVVAAIISCTLAALWRDAYRDRSAC
jgi:hypothetical protein